MFEKKNIIKSLIFIVLLVFLFTSELQAQRWKLRRYEVGAGIGAMQVFGDIGGTASESNWFGLKDISFKESRLAFGGNIRYKITPLYSFRFNVNYGYAKGSDSESRNAGRGYSYKARILEFSGQGEYYFLTEEKSFRSAAMYNRRGMINNYNQLSAYTFIGVGVSRSKSVTSFTDPRPIDDFNPGTRFVLVIPLGVGAKFILDDHLMIDAQLGYRYALSDYLDGYKNINSSRFNDIYYFFLLSVNYRLKTSRRNIPAFLDRRYRRFGY